MDLTGGEDLADREPSAPMVAFAPVPAAAVGASPLVGRVVLAIEGSDRPDWLAIGDMDGVARLAATGMFGLGLPKLFGNHLLSRDRSGIGLVAGYDDFASAVRRFTDDVLDPGTPGWVVEAVDRGRPLDLAQALYPDATVVDVDDDAVAALSRPAPVGGPGHRPTTEPAGLILVVGAPRSGTTWLEQMLLAHPEVGGVEEAETGLFKAVSELWVNHRGAGRLAEVADAEKLACALRRLTGALLGDHLQRTGERSWFVEKTPVHVRFLPQIAAVWPEAWIVNLVRDGRDVARSVVELTYGPDDLRAAAALWCADVLAGDRSAPVVPRFREVRYEDLLADPVGRTVEIFDWVGLGLDDAALAELEVAAARRVSQFNTTGPVGSGKWRSLPRRDLRTVLNVAGDVLVAKGYVEVREVRRARRRAKAGLLVRRAMRRSRRRPRPP